MKASSRSSSTSRGWTTYNSFGEELEGGLRWNAFELIWNSLKELKALIRGIGKGKGRGFVLLRGLFKIVRARGGRVSLSCLEGGAIGEMISLSALWLNKNLIIRRL